MMRNSFRKNTSFPYLSFSIDMQIPYDLVLKYVDYEESQGAFWASEQMGYRHDMPAFVCRAIDLIIAKERNRRGQIWREKNNLSTSGCGG